MWGVEAPRFLLTVAVLAELSRSAECDLLPSVLKLRVFLGVQFMKLCSFIERQGMLGSGPSEPIGALLTFRTHVVSSFLRTSSLLTEIAGYIALTSHTHRSSHTVSVTHR